MSLQIVAISSVMALFDLPINFVQHVEYTGHGELLELRLLEKSARHDFIIARKRSSNNIFSCQLLESS